MLQPLVQKYPSAYYAYVGSSVHYVMYEGIRTRHDSKDEALRICEETNARYGLPDINVDKSSYYQPRKVTNVP